MLFTALLFPAAFAGWAVGHYTTLGGKPSGTVVHTVTAAAPTPPATTTSAAATTSAATTTSSSGGGGAGDAAAGKAVFTANGCASCHTFKPANATGTIGPDLDSAPASDAKADGNMDLTAFIHQSIIDPNAYIAKGYSKGIMPTNFGSSLSAKQINDLVAFILSGTSKS